jgi:type I restriction enzyme M protein
LAATLKAIEQSTLGSDSADDFANLFEDLDLNSTKLGNTASDRNELVAKVLSHLDDIDFDISNTESDVLGDAYEYLIGEFASGAGKKQGSFIHHKRYRLYWRRLSRKENSFTFCL